MGEKFHSWIQEQTPGFYHIVFPQTSTEEEVAGFCRASLEYWKNIRCPTITIVDCRQVKKAPAAQRKLFADNIDHIKPYSQKFQVAVALVVPNTLVKGLVTAIYWVAPPGYHYKVFTDIEIARTWLQEQLLNESKDAA